MMIRNYNEMSRKQNAHGISSWQLHDSENAVIMHLLLQPGEELIPHITPVDVVFYVLEGEPHIQVGEERKQAAVDDLITSPRNIVHCIYNPGSSKARILVIKTPRPQSAAKLLNTKNKQEERMVFKVNKEVCVGCGACEAACPQVFAMKDGKAEVILNPVTSQYNDCALEAEDICPVQAISHQK